MKPTQQDEEVLASVQSIVDLMRDQGLLRGMDANSSRQLSQVLRQVIPLIPELAPGLGYTGGAFSSLRSLMGFPGVRHSRYGCCMSRKSPGIALKVAKPVSLSTQSVCGCRGWAWLLGAEKSFHAFQCVCMCGVASHVKNGEELCGRNRATQCLMSHTELQASCL